MLPDSIDPAGLSGPLDGYRRLTAAGVLRQDLAQELAAEKLQILDNRLKRYTPGQGGGWRVLFRRDHEPAPQGVYMCGGVGRGKSMLMDLFFQTTTFTPKRRVHFHEFMLEVHETIHKWRSIDEAARRAQGFEGDDPIPPLARQIADGAVLLCFDEFQVSDVADAMILGRLFTNLFENGVVVVVTSNRSPDTLYEGGLNRELFLPFIEMIKEQLDVLHLASPTDYRLVRIKDMAVYHMPLSGQSDRELDQMFKVLTDQDEGAPEKVTVQQGRTLPVSQAAMGVARFGFAELCEEALGAADYLAIARAYHTVILAGIPQMGPDQRNAAKRFVTLIDALYDNGIKLICSAQVRPEELYETGDGTFDFARTASRLIEMQSHDYFEASVKKK